MTTDAFDTITRSRGRSQRRTLLASGAAGLAAAMAETFTASSKKNSGQKCKTRIRKHCEQQSESCSDQVTALCAQSAADQAECLTILLPCCDTCDVSVGVLCTLNAFLTPA